MVAIGSHAIIIQAAKIKIMKLAALGGREAGAVTRGKQAGPGIDRHPAVGSQVNFGPIMNIVETRDRGPSPSAIGPGFHASGTT